MGGVKRSLILQYSYLIVVDMFNLLLEYINDICDGAEIFAWRLSEYFHDL